MNNPLSGALAAIQSLAAKAAEPEDREVGPGDAAPTIDTKSAELVTLPFTAEDIAEWWKQVEQATTRMRQRWETWDILLQEYLPKVVKSGTPEAVKYNGHFRNVHTKMGQLFYRSPDLILTPKDPSPAQNQMPNPMNPAEMISMEDVISVKQAVLMSKLGRDGIKADRLMDEVIFDVLAWAGIGCTKTGYRCFTAPVQQPVMAPMAQPGQVLGLGAPPQMQPTGETQTVQVPIYEEYFSRRFSPKKYLCDANLHSTRFEEDSTWQGMRFFLSPKEAMAKLQLSEDEANKAANDTYLFKHPEDGATETRPLVACIEIWCKARYYTEQAKHPLLYAQLVLVEGLRERPAIWRLSPDQALDPMTGQLTKDSFIGSPIDVLTIRDLADNFCPPSDEAFANTNIKEISTYRRQSVKLRDAAIGKYLFDQGAFEEEEVTSLKDGSIGDYIPVKEGLLAKGKDTVLTTTTQLTAARDDYKGAQMLKQDMDETLGISATQSGAETDTVRTATEIASFSQGSRARSDKERSRVIEFYLTIARKIDQLLMRYATQEDYIQIGGEDSARRMMLWNNQLIAGRYYYDITPDSQIVEDNSADYKELLQFYNLAAPDPLFNRAYVLRRLARMRRLDPAKVVLNPMQQLTQPPHAGPSQKGEAVNQHTASNSGRRPSEPGADNQRETQIQ
jgi:hypothetical protein